LSVSAAPRTRWTTARLAGVVVAGDAAAALAGLVLGAGERGMRPAPAVAIVTLVVLFLARGGFYRPRLHLSVLADLPGIAGRSFIAGALTTVVLPLPIAGLTGALAAGTVVTLAVVAWRLVVQVVIRRLRATRRIAHRTLILGGGQVATGLGAALLDRPEHGLLPVGFLDSGPHAGTHPGRLPNLGQIADLAPAIRTYDIDTVIVAFSSGREVEKVELLRACDRLAVEIFVVPRLFELHTVGRDMDTVWGIPLARLTRGAFRSFSWKLKRLMDVLVAGVASVLLLPVLLACALASRCETGGVFFRQTRVGLDGRQFQMLKFMSMKPVDDADAHRNWSIGSDARVGPVGRLMRRLSLDELPQLINVLRGDMTLVGPRPERIYFVELLAGQFPRYMARHRVPAGLTGWAQVNGLRGDTSIEDRVRFDNYYIENWSLWLDVQILVRTLVQVFRAVGR
jgi:exopolysaccharide biosynthesis polyprenyl glycosylphosphotransferase